MIKNPTRLIVKIWIRPIFQVLKIKKLMSFLRTKVCLALFRRQDLTPVRVGFRKCRAALTRRFLNEPREFHPADGIRNISNWLTAKVIGEEWELTRPVLFILDGFLSIGSPLRSLQWGLWPRELRRKFIFKKRLG